MYTSKLFFLHVACSPATRGNPQGVKFQEAGGLTVCCMANGDVLFNEIKATRQRGADRKWQGGVVRFPQRCITGCSVHPCAYVNGLNRLLTKSKTWSATVKRNTCGTQLSSSNISGTDKLITLMMVIITITVASLGRAISVCCNYRTQTHNSVLNGVGWNV